MKRVWPCLCTFLRSLLFTPEIVIGCWKLSRKSSFFFCNLFFLDFYCSYIFNPFELFLPNNFFSPHPYKSFYTLNFSFSPIDYSSDGNPYIAKIYFLYCRSTFYYCSTNKYFPCSYPPKRISNLLLCCLNNTSLPFWCYPLSAI